MDPLSQKSIERVVSQRALQMGSSFPCQISVVGFLCGVCLTSVFLAAIGLAPISFSYIPVGNSLWKNSSNSAVTDILMSTDCKLQAKETERWANNRRGSIVGNEVEDDDDNGAISLLYSAWSELLNESINGEVRLFGTVGVSKADVPNAPHLEDCKLNARSNERLDKRGEHGSFPPWTTWKGMLNNQLIRNFRHQDISEGAYPPWIRGSDEENYPLTRRVQRDLWIHQHPTNCRDPSLRFLVADWERLPGFGIGAQFAGMCGLLAIAINEKRILVTDYYNRADHDDCKGTARSSWSCYFLPETSKGCKLRAFELMADKEAWENGIITTKRNYSSKQIWAGRIPRAWGEPWSYLQPTTEINGSLLLSHRKMDRRWWRAQAIRYLMRFQTEYTCGLMNVARNSAFGKEAAKMVLKSLGGQWPKESRNKPRSGLEEYVWSNQKPWVPRPLLSMHVRMGDKACEMKLVQFTGYMQLAGRIRTRFPHLTNIWLSTEMQEVVDKSKQYKNWQFYYTNVTRQVGSMVMASYEASLGRKTSTNYPLVNFLMATEADFFVGALGSTWCFLIDGMRNTGGKVMAGYLSVNKDRFW